MTNKIPVINMAATGTRITELRKKRNITVREIEDTLGVTKNAVCKWQRGETLPSIDNLVGLAAMLDVTLNEIVATN